MKRWIVVLPLILAVGVLAGCGQGQATPTSTGEGAGETYSSAVLDASYEDALDASTQLVLGTIRLEETENAITPEQAKALLPLWQSLRGGVTVQAEVNAVLKQIEGTMTQEQLAAIAAMQLTQEDLQSWMQEQGMGGGFGGPGGQGLSSDEMATRRAEFGDVSEEERANLRATMEAGGGGFPGGGQFGDMSEEERANLRATMEAGGGAPGGGFPGGAPSGGGGRGGAGGGQFGFLLNPLIELLTERATE